MPSIRSPRFIAAALLAFGALGAASAAQARTDVVFSLGVQPAYVTGAPVFVQPRPLYAPEYVQVQPAYDYGYGYTQTYAYPSIDQQRWIAERRAAEIHREQWRREEWRREEWRREHRDHDGRWDHDEGGWRR